MNKQECKDTDKKTHEKNTQSCTPPQPSAGKTSCGEHEHGSVKAKTGTQSECMQENEEEEDDIKE